MSAPAHVTPAVTLTPADAGNWRACTDLQVTDEQRGFVADVAYYLALCAYDDGPWRPLAVLVEDRVVGFLMEGVDPSDHSLWLGGLVVDAAVQGRGVGRATVATFLARAAAAGHRQVELSYHPDNVTARRLYTEAGFTETGEWEGEEVVARCPLEAEEGL